MWRDAGAVDPKKPSRPLGRGGAPKIDVAKAKRRASSSARSVARLFPRRPCVRQILFHIRLGTGAFFKWGGLRTNAVDAPLEPDLRPRERRRPGRGSGATSSPFSSSSSTK